MNPLRQTAAGGQKDDGQGSGKEGPGGDQSDLAARWPGSAVSAHGTSALPGGAAAAGAGAWPGAAAAGMNTWPSASAWPGSPATAVAGAGARVGGPGSSTGAAALSEGAASAGGWPDWRIGGLALPRWLSGRTGSVLTPLPPASSPKPLRRSEMRLLKMPRLKKRCQLWLPQLADDVGAHPGRRFVLPLLPSTSTSPIQDQVLIGNRSNTNLNKAGYKNVIQMFKERIGVVHTRIQFKNKWDRLKNDYSIWKQLINKEKGIGWDESKKNIVMPEAWWKRTVKAIKGSARFKFKGLQNKDKLKIIFEDLRNTSDDNWCASSGIVPSQGNLSCENSPINVDEEDEADNDEDSEPEEVTSTSGTGKRGRVNGNTKGKKPKTTIGHWFHEQMGKIVEMNERKTASCESIARRENKFGCSIQDVMALVKACGATSGTNEHFIASLVFTKSAERKMFMTLDAPEERFEWL